MKKLMTLICAISAFSAIAQEAKPLSEVEKLAQRTEALEVQLKKMGQLKISGYIQAQWQHAETAGMKNSFGGGDFGTDLRDRFSVRRGRVKVAYTNSFGGIVLQIDATEKGIGFKDAYLMLAAPQFPQLKLTAGIFDRPFGYEISYSSSVRESPERSRLFQSLFPGERDLGAKLTFQPAKESAWNPLKIEGGLFAGNGIAAETDNRKDFIGHLSWSKTPNDRFSYGIGASLYAGGVKQRTEHVFKMKNGAFQMDAKPENKKEYAHRTYYGLDGQLSVSSVLGLTQLRAEYLWGQQPGVADGNTSPKEAVTGDLYLRNFTGGYVYLIQDLGHSKFSGVVKFDYYDPNSKVSGDRIDPAKGFSAKGADIAYTTWGLGMLFRMNANVRLMAYYDLVRNETTQKIAGFASDIKDNLVTVRVQYKF